MKLSRINTVLCIATVLICAYIMIAPLAPLMAFWIATHTGSRMRSLNQELTLPINRVPASPSDNRLVIPAMLLDTPINEGRDLSALRTGPWRRPNGSTPAAGGNTVIAGHRFTYTNPRGTFYFLNKLQPGDRIGIFWRGKRYLYRVTASETVPPTAGNIEAPTKDAQLTLYTCTPLWLPKNRLVVIAKLEQVS
ncbi:MAG TPA: class E sortase [Candidatus Saccharimonadales bacterium]|nr:class E sortase [Candidatus Saccharimonadales bacterium]